MNWQERFMTITIGLIALLGLGIIAGQYFHYEVTWRSDYDRLHQFGHTCEGDIGKNDGKLDQAIAQRHSFTAMPMPIRGQDVQPLTYEGQHLIVRCFPDLSQLSTTGFAQLTLGRPQSETLVYLNGKLLYHAQETHNVDIYLPPEDRIKDAELVLVSAGTASGVAGLFHPLPLGFSDNIKDFSRIQTRITALFHEIPAALALAAFGLVCLFSLAGLMGMRHSDLNWVMVVLFTFIVARLAEYQPVVELYGVAMKYRFIGFSSFAVNLAMVGFATQFLRLRALRTVLPVVFVGGLVLFGMACFGTTTKEFFVWRLAYMTPTIVGALGLATVVVVGVTSFCTRPPDRRRGRIITFLVCMGIAALALTGEALLQEYYAVYVSRYVSLGIVLQFALFLAADIVIYEKRAMMVRQRRIERAHVATVNLAKRSLQEIAHDVRKPFSFLKNLVDFMLLEPDLAVRQKQIEKYVPSLKTTLFTVDAILADAVDVAWGETAIAEVCDVKALIGQAVEQVKTGSSEPQVISCQVPERLTVRIHPTKVIRILINILQNAVDATAGQAAMTLQVSHHDLEGTLLFRVHNSGSYIPPERCERVFDSFYSHGKGRGMGLGLAICQRLVSSHGGVIWCESDPKAGTTFFFTIREQEPKEKMA